MRKISAAIIFCTALFSFTYVYDVFQQIGTTLEEAKQKTLEQMAHDEFDFYGATYDMQQACKKLPVGVREATVIEAAKQLRAYVESPGFKADYGAYLKKTYPLATFNANDEKWAEMKKSKLEEFTNTLNMQVPNFDPVQTFAQQLDVEISADSSLMAMGDDQLTAMNMTRDNFRQDITDDKMLKDLYAKDKTAFKAKYAEIAAARGVRNEMASEKLDVDNNNQRNKEKIAALGDYKSLLRKQLQGFIDATGDIDFTAQLKEQGNVKVFVNPDYESKPGDWKFYYRCGKEYVTSARKFAQDWLSNLH